MTVVLSFVIGLLVTAPGPDLEFVADPPKDPAKLAVPDKVTIVVVGLEGCGACKVFVKQASVIAASNPKLAIRAVDGAHDNTLKYMPPQAPVPFARVYDLQGKERYAGPVDDGQLVKEAILAGLGTPADVDPELALVCTACATKLAYEEKDVVPAGKAKVGDLSRCPMSGVVFEVKQDSPKTDRGYTCCGACKAKHEARSKG